MAIEFHRDGPWELPEGWVWARLGDVCRHPGRIDPKRQLRGQFRYIDLSAIEDGKITQSQFIPVERAPSRARQPVRSGDTLLSCVRVYLRNNVIVPDELNGSIASTAFCILRPTEAADPHYIFWFVHSRKFTETLVPLQRGNSPPAVLDDDVRDQLIPIAPRAEQGRIVGRIEELFNEIADGESALSHVFKEALNADQLRQSIVKAAYEGKLVAQDLRDEPAERLLSRLSEQLGESAGAPRRTRLKRTALVAE